MAKKALITRYHARLVSMPSHRESALLAQQVEGRGQDPRWTIVFLDLVRHDFFALGEHPSAVPNAGETRHGAQT